MREIDAYFLSVVDPKKPIVYLPVAMEPETFTYEQCFSWFRETYEPLGIRNVELWTDLQGKTLSSQIGGVFIGGGNTYRLLQIVRETGFDQQLRRFAQAGGLIYGGSAGAILLGKTIGPETYTDSKNPGITDLSGLDLLQGYDVWCHYQPAQAPEVEAYGTPLVVLWEESGLVVTEQGFTGIGKPYFRNKAGTLL